MGQTALPCLLPIPVQPVAVADQDPLPISNQAMKGLLRAVGMDHEKRNRRTRHIPQPVQFAALSPWGFIHMIDRRLVGLFANRLIMRQDGLRGPVNNLLQCTKADGAAQSRGAERLGRLPTVAFNTAEFSHQGRKPRTKASLKLLRRMACAGFPALCTLAPVKNEMENRQHDFRQLDVLVGMVGLEIDEVLTATAARARMELLGAGWRQELLPVPFAALAASGFFPARFGRIFLVGRIR